LSIQNYYSRFVKNSVATGTHTLILILNIMAAKKKAKKVVKKKATKKAKKKR
jgi:hypothetical protein